MYLDVFICGLLLDLACGGPNFVGHGRQRVLWIGRRCFVLRQQGLGCSWLDLYSRIYRQRLICWGIQITGAQICGLQWFKIRTF